MRRWWIPDTLQTFPGGIEEAAEELRGRFLSSIRLHLRSDVPVGAALSGGIDSSAIVCAMRHEAPDVEIQTFSFVSPDERMSEARWVDTVTSHARTVPHSVSVGDADFSRDLSAVIRAQGEPFVSTSMYAQFRVFEAARASGVRVVLEGQGADELLAGYEGYPGQRMRSLYEIGDWVGLAQFANAWSARSGRSVGSAWRAFAGQLLSPSLHATILARSDNHRAVPWLRTGVLRSAGVQLRSPLLPKAKHNRGRRVIEALAESLADQELPSLLRFGDRNAMHSSVENRVPFLTLPLADFLLSLPEEMLIGPDGTTKRVFRLAMRGLVPDAILDRKDKIGFVTPMASWAPAAVSSRAGAIAALAHVPFIDGALLRAVFDDIGAHRTPLTATAWRTFNLAIWMEEFGVVA